MNALKHRFTLEMTVLHSQATIHIKKYDTKNKLVISLSEHGKPYEISQNVHAVFVGKKPDGKIVFNDCVITGNTIEYTITAQTSVTVGIVGCEIRLYDDNKNLLTSPRFTVVVDEIVYDENEVEIESENEFNVFVELLSETKALLEANERGELNGKDGATFTPYIHTPAVLSWSNNRELDNPNPYYLYRDVAETLGWSKYGGEVDVLNDRRWYRVHTATTLDFAVQMLITKTDDQTQLINIGASFDLPAGSTFRVNEVLPYDYQFSVYIEQWVDGIDSDTGLGLEVINFDLSSIGLKSIESVKSIGMISTSLLWRNGSADGKDGADGTDGHTPVVTATKSNGVTSLKVDGVEIAQIADGKDGAAGATGESGYTPQKGVDYFDGEDGADGISVIHSWDGTTLTVTSASGTSSANLKGDPGERGPQGAPYTLTNADKAAIVAEVLANFTDASEVAL